MALPTVSGEFLVIGDPVLRFTPSGVAVANLRLKAASRQQNQQSQQWEDKDVLWIDASVWRDPAQHVVDSIKDKDLVVVTGEIKTREWEDKNGGGKRSQIELAIRSIGPSLQFRTTPHGAGGGQQAGQQTQVAPAPGQQVAPPPYGGQQAPQYGGGQPQQQQPYQQPQQQPQYGGQQPPQQQPQYGDPWAAPQGQQGPPF